MTRPRRDFIPRMMRTGMLVPLILLFAASTSWGTTLDNYTAKVDSAWTAAVQVENSLREKAVGDHTGREFAAQIRGDFPASERIEWEGGTVETTNSWLLEKIGEMERETDSKKKLVSVVEIREYLSSISFNLKELEQAAAAEARKDKDKQKLGEILRREEYQKPQEKQESVFQRWLSAFLEWLEGIFPKSSGPAPPSMGMSFVATLLQVLLYAVLLGLLVFIVYKVVPLIFPHLKRTRQPRSKKQRTILGEQLSEDVTAADLFDEAESLARDGNLRGAIRKGYIALLCDLSDRKVIGLARNKTNRDYLRDVRSRRDLHPRMMSVTDTFERHWYGLQGSEEQDWARFREEYKAAIRSV
ncbi:MAG: DUF4129 domain-containing protein [Pyrinomonadaceae bacterium]